MKPLFRSDRYLVFLINDAATVFILCVTVVYMNRLPFACMDPLASIHLRAVLPMSTPYHG